MSAAPPKKQAPRGRPTGPTKPFIDTLFQGLRWVFPGLVLAYLLSGVTVVRSDEVALVLRFGALAGGPAAAQRQPGLHYVFPRPIDEVVRVKVKRVYEVEINDLHARGRAGRSSPKSIDPTLQGYTLTGDQNIIQVDLVARFQIEDPVAFALQQSDPEAVLRSSVKAAAVRTMGELEVDGVLSEGRSQFISTVLQRAQVRLQSAQAGIDLVSIEVTDLSPPEQVQSDFEEVQNAFIDLRTKVTEAKRQREQSLPRAQAERDQELRDAEVFATELLARANGDTAAWRSLYAEYQSQPKVLRQRLYLETVERALPSVASLRFVPPPQGRRYPAESFRISISPRD